MPAVRLDRAKHRGALEALPRRRLRALRQSVPDRRNHASRQALLRRVWGEFDELRTLRLTLAQAGRLFGVREDICLRVLNTLVDDGLLRVTPEHVYTRRIDA